jgi:hypothetical protein
MRDLEIRPAISVWDARFRRWGRVGNCYELLRLLDEILHERPPVTKGEPSGSDPGHEPPATAAHRQILMLLAQVEAEMENRPNQLSAGTKLKSITVIRRHRLIRQAA